MICTIFYVFVKSKSCCIAPIAAASFFSCFFRTRKKDRANSGTNHFEKKKYSASKNGKL